MAEQIARLDGEEFLALCGILLGLVGVVGGISIGLVAVVAYHFRRSRMDDIEATLKLEMVQRGMPADEIRKVLEARATICPAPPSMPDGRHPAWGKHRRQFAKT